MIAVDSSAIIALALGEPDSERFAPPIAGTGCYIGWPTVFEINLVLAGGGKKTALEIVRLWLARPNVTKLDFDETLHHAAISAFTTFGKWMGHPAKLNFGDCMAYAVAKVHDVPLLYKGDDFALTDIRPALS